MHRRVPYATLLQIIVAVLGQNIRGLTPPLTSPPLPFPFTSPFLSPSRPSFPALPLEVGPLNTAKGPVERCKLPSGVWGGALAEIEFCAF